VETITRQSTNSNRRILFLAKNKVRDKLASELLNPTGLGGYRCKGNEGEDRLIKGKNIHVFFWEWVGIFQEFWLHLFFNLFMDLSNCHQGNYQLSWYWRVCHLIWKWHYNEVRGYLVVTLIAILDPISFC
jgi:hypothetical protein